MDRTLSPRDDPARAVSATLGDVTIDPDALLSDASVRAAIGALASRNSHHLEAMTEDERAGALHHWQELVIDVLTAARSALEDPALAQEGGVSIEGDLPGRAVIVLQDAGGEDVTVHATFHPELEDLGDGEVGGTPAQITGVMLLQSLGGEEPDDE